MKSKPQRGRRMPARVQRYDVGYAKPPVESQFKAGQSGNPNGRPKGSRSKPKRSGAMESKLASIVLEEANRKVKINSGGSTKKICLAKAVVRSAGHNAAKGNGRAQKLFTDLVYRAEDRKREQFDEHLEVVMCYREYWAKEMRRRHDYDIETVLLPHPDHLIIDEKTAVVWLVGPFDEDEKLHWDKFQDLKAVQRENITVLSEMLKTAAECERDAILEDLEVCKRMERKLDKLLSMFNRPLGSSD